MDPRELPRHEDKDWERRNDPARVYWEGFRLMNEGSCDAAIRRLEPLARRGRGFEHAQHGLGVCQLRLAGMPENASTNVPEEAQLRADPRFEEGMTWVLRAARAGQFDAQRTLIALYVAGLGPTDDPLDLARWLHLYNVNPTRQTLGIIDPDDALLTRARTLLTDEQILKGRIEAREWTPAFWVSKPEKTARSPSP